MSELPIFENFLSVRNLKPKLELFFKAKFKPQCFLLNCPPPSCPWDDRDDCCMMPGTFSCHVSKEAKIPLCEDLGDECLMVGDGGDGGFLFSFPTITYSGCDFGKGYVEGGVFTAPAAGMYQINLDVKMELPMYTPTIPMRHNGFFWHNRKSKSRKKISRTQEAAYSILITMKKTTKKT